jgi:hypothetical protein
MLSRLPFFPSSSHTPSVAFSFIRLLSPRDLFFFLFSSFFLYRSLSPFLPLLEHSFCSKGEMIYAQIKQMLARRKDRLGQESNVHGAMLHAASHGEWEVLRPWATQYRCLREALLVAAERGNAEFVCDNFEPDFVADIVVAAARGGKLGVISLLVERCGIEGLDRILLSSLFFGAAQFTDSHGRKQGATAPQAHSFIHSVH